MSVNTPGNESLGNKILRDAPKYERVEIIRQRLLATDYEKYPDVERLRYAVETGVVANFHEGFERTDEMKAYDEMIIEMRVPPGKLSRQCRDAFLGFLLESGGLGA